MMPIEIGRAREGDQLRMTIGNSRGFIGKNNKCYCIGKSYKYVME